MTHTSPKNVSQDEFSRILCIRTDRIGDMMIATPVFRALRKRYPKARIDVLASRLNHIAVQGNPYLDNVYVFDKKAFWTWPCLVLTLRKVRYDCCIVLNSTSGTTCNLMRTLGIPHRFGFHVQEKHRKLFTEILPKPHDVHVISGTLAALSRFGIENPSPDLDFVVPENLCPAMQARFPRQEGRIRLAIFIGNIKKIQNRWPPEKFVQLMQNLLEQHDHVDLVVFAGPSDRPLLPFFEDIAQNPRVQIFVGESFQESGAFLQQCDAFIGGSTGPTHLASALNVPVLSIITQYNVHYWHPLGEQHKWVAPPTDITDMRQIPVDEVLAMVNEFVEEQGKQQDRQ